MKVATLESMVRFIKELYSGEQFVPLHVPRFSGNEKTYVLKCIDTAFVSSVGEFVDQFERAFEQYTGAKRAVATVNGTAALQVALELVGVNAGDEVITQPVTFVATTNAITYCSAKPVFVDVDRKTLGMSASSLAEFLKASAIRKDDGHCYNRLSGSRIAACVPVHVFGHPVRIDEVKSICESYGIPIVEDAAESIGSTYKGIHTGRTGMVGSFSFNGNKTITTGGGGMIITDDEALGAFAKHLTTTAKRPHRWEYFHDHIGYNYRMPNINAALGCAQLETLPAFLQSKRAVARQYEEFFQRHGIEFFKEPADCSSNYWLNVILCADRKERDQVLEYTNTNGVMTRPLWTLMNKLPMFAGCQTADITMARWLEDRVVNIPSSTAMKLP